LRRNSNWKEYKVN